MSKTPFTSHVQTDIMGICTNGGAAANGRKEAEHCELYLLLPVPGMVYTFNLARCYQFFPNCILRILEFATAKIERRKRKTGGRLQRAGGQRRSTGVSVEAGGSVCSTRRLEENDGAGKSIYCIGFHRDV